MLAVIVCNLCSVAMLLGLLAGVTVGFVQAGGAVGDALAFDRRLGVRPRARRAVRSLPA